MNLVYVLLAAILLILLIRMLTGEAYGCEAVYRGGLPTLCSSAPVQ